MNDYIKSILAKTGTNIWEINTEVNQNWNMSNPDHLEAYEYFCGDNKQTPMCIHEFIECYVDLVCAWWDSISPELTEESEDIFDYIMNAVDSDGDIEPLFILLSAVEHYDSTMDFEEEVNIINWFNNNTRFNIHAFCSTWVTWQVEACCLGVRESFGKCECGGPLQWSYADE